MIRRGGQKVMYIPGDSMRVTQPAAAIPWWLSGGISAANCVAAYQPKGAASYLASKTNLASPGTNDAVDGAAYPTWAAVDGWTFVSASSQYLLAGTLLPATDQSWSAIIRYSSYTNAGRLFGKDQGVGRRFSIRYLNPNMLYGNGAELSIATLVGTGVMAFAGNVAYRNGVAETGTIGAWTGASTGLGIAIGAYTTAAAAAGFSDVKIQAFALYNTPITAGQVLAVTNAMNAL